MLHISLKLTFLKWEQKKNYNNIGRFPGGGLENQNPARTIAHSPPGVKETLNYMLREKKHQTKSPKQQHLKSIKTYNMDPAVRFGSVRFNPGPVHTGSGSYKKI